MELARSKETRKVGCVYSASSALGPMLWRSGSEDRARVVALDGSQTVLDLSGKTLSQPYAAEDLFTAVSYCPCCRASQEESSPNGKVRQFFWQVELVICARCGLLYKTKQLNAELLKSLYETDYSNFKFVTQELAYQNNQPRIARLGQPRGRLLDAGCGAGAFVSAAKMAGYDAHGADPFLPTETKDTMSTLHRLDVQVPEDRKQLGSFDVITLWAVWEHLLDPLSMLRACSTMLNPGGRIVFNSPNGRSIHAKRSLSNWYMATLLEHLHFLTPTTCDFLATSLNLSIASLTYGGTPYPMGSRGKGAAAQGLNDKLCSRLFGATASPMCSDTPKTPTKPPSLVVRLTRQPHVGKMMRTGLNLTRLGDHLEIQLRKE